MSKISFLGAGSWGTALAIMLAKNGHKVTLWSKVKEEVDMLRQHREHIHRLPGVKLPSSIKITDKDEEVVESDTDIVVMSVASPYVRATAAEFSHFIPRGMKIVDVAKGIEEETLKPLCDVITEEIPQADVSILSGPSHAEEVSVGQPTAVVVGAKSRETASFIQKVFMNDSFRVYTSSDVIGIEMGGAIKNVIALAAGVLDGMGCGDNTKAALMTRGIYEISLLGKAMGGKAETLFGLSGIGDLIVTCTSNHSRNHNAGYLIGKGYTCEAAMEEVNQVVEGVYAVKAAHKLAEKYGVSMPIVEEVYNVLFNGVSAVDAIFHLLRREGKDEYMDDSWE